MTAHNITGEYLLALLRSALNGSTPPEIPADVCWEDVFLLAKRHSVANMAWYAMSRSPAQPDEETREAWDRYHELAILKDVNQACERDALVGQFSRAGIDILLFKGFELKAIYPQTDYREMADIDALIRPEDVERADALIHSMGYATSSIHFSHHIEYIKKPLFCVELHSTLMPTEYKKYHRYYQNFWDRVTPSAENPHVWQMRQEDAFIYMLAHFAKHYFAQGSGIRSVLDVLVYERAYRDRFDWHYIRREMKKLGIYGFYQDTLALAKHWFEGGSVNRRQQNMGDCILDSSTYGARTDSEKFRIQKLSNNGSRTVGKVKYYLRMVFLPYDIMKTQYPVLRKAPVLLPLFWVVRWFAVLLTRPKRIVQNLRHVKNL